MIGVARLVVFYGEGTSDTDTHILMNVCAHWHTCTHLKVIQVSIAQPVVGAYSV